MSRAFLFPGQGSQIVGMGKDFFQSFSRSRSIFEEVDDTLTYSLSKIIFEGPIDQLNKTINTQPALMAVSVAIFSEILHQSGVNIHQLCSAMAGHSLGEYSALCCSNAITLSTTTQLLQARAASMQEACEGQNCSMAAIVGISIAELEKYLKQINKGDLILDIANDNSDQQIVVSGHNQLLTKLQEISLDNKFRYVPLQAGGAFHSRIVEPATKKFNPALSKHEIIMPKVNVISNINAEIYNGVDQIRENLSKQIHHPVAWRQTMLALWNMGIDELVEIGPSTILSNLAKKSNLDFKISNISTTEQLDKFLNTL